MSLLPDYRIFVLDAGGRIKGAHELRAIDDAGALEAAVNLEKQFGLEVWQRARRVGLIDPQGNFQRS